MEDNKTVTYIAGNGTIAIAVGRVISNDYAIVPFVELYVLDEKQEIGSEVTSDKGDKFSTRIIFENLESIEAMRRSLDICVAELLKNK